MQAIRRPQMPMLLFLGIVIGVYGAALAIASRLADLKSAGLVATGLTLDLVIMVPLAYYFLVVRRGGHSIVRLAPALVLSLILASLILPSDHQHALHILELVMVPVELGLLGWIFWRAARALRKAGRKTSQDPLEQFRSAAFGFLQNDRVAGVFASEIAVFYYSLGAWRSPAHCSDDATAFTHHRRSGQAAIVMIFLLLMMAEGVAVHFLLSGWSAIAAWLFSISTLYAALWLIADYRATVLRPILVNEKTLLFRAGLRYTVEVSRSCIAEIVRQQPDCVNQTISLKLFGPPTHWVVFSEPVEAQGLYGMRRMVRAVGIEPDDAQQFERTLDII